ncbi:hypothetical protein C1N71_03675 [Agrococcus sp. SGAir0287]|nr:hypothetical protein C1N71_03675 [Agrococcus sp. SGAir0287]
MRCAPGVARQRRSSRSRATSSSPRERRAYLPRTTPATTPGTRSTRARGSSARRRSCAAFSSRMRRCAAVPSPRALASRASDVARSALRACAPESSSSSRPTFCRSESLRTPIWFAPCWR